MPTSQRPFWPTLLAAFRLLATFALACYLVLQVGLTLRTLRAQPAYLATPAAPRAFPYLGIHVDLAQYPAPQQRRVLDEVAAAGFGWVRVPIGWDAIEPEPGHFDWSHTDPMPAALAASNLEAVIVLNGSPAWARAPQDQETPQGRLAPPADPQDFAAFARAFAARYGAHLRYYQIWDEPNIAPHWGARHIEPVGYAQLLKAAAQALRAADGDAQIITAALAPTTDRGHLALDEVTFLRRLYAAGAASSFDAVAVQPFGFGTAPDATPVGRNHLNFRRVQWVRAAMLAAGDGATPILIARYGWNRDPASPWGTVTPANQVDFAVDALDLAYRHWPWVMGQAWAIDQPDAPVNDAIWGFARTPGLTEAWQTWLAARPVRPTAVPAPPWQPVAQLGGWLILLAVTVWRGLAAARRMPWSRWGDWLRRGPQRLLTAWALLILVYYFATWPPLIVLCWSVAAWLVWLRPTWGLYGALALLPLHIYHKELHLVDYRVSVPPAYALVGALLPAWLRLRPWTLYRLSALNLFAIGRLVLGLTGLFTAWYLPGALKGLVELVLVPLLVYAMLRAWAATPRRAYAAAGALAAGGLLAALIGLIDWGLGGGTVADGMRRLVGPTFSPNHTALYLVRTLPLLVGMVWMGGSLRRVWAAAALLVGAALLLTGSRGGLLLGLPVGLFVLWQMHRAPRNDASFAWRRLWPVALGITVIGVVGVLLLFGVRDRLLNLATAAERVAIWQASLALWRDHAWLGVGPGGFYWTFPAHIPAGSTLDPNLRHPHNIWLELATQAGWAGLLWFMALVYVAVRTVRAVGRQPERAAAWAGVRIGLVAGLCAALAHAQVDAWQALPDLAAWNWAALALLVTWTGTRAQTKAATQSGSGSL